MRLSYWERSEVERLRDAIIIGAGLVGMSAAIELKRKMPKASITVIEKQIIGCAASTRNAGFACFGSVSEILSDIEVYGEQDTIDLVNKRRSGISSLKTRYSQDTLGYIASGGYEIFNNQSEYDKYAGQLSRVNQLLGSDVFERRKTPTPIKSYERCIFNKYEGQLDTGRFYNALVREARSLDIEVLKGLEVVDIDLARGILSCAIEDLTIDMVADKVIIATNSLTSTLLPQLDVKAVRNQVILTQKLGNHEVRGCFHQDKGYIYYRDIGERILIGGARHLYEDEETGIFGDNPENQDYLLNHLRKYVLPHVENVRIDQSWSGILSGGTNRMPIVKRLSDKVTVAARLSGMGVAIGIDVGIEAATLALV